ncbi:MAG: threonine/serine exporter family protein [Kofleriaceae bacterium]|nr:threonine/serine exporter family protein [Myxococcales bacterium]MCB9559434.1 threonine/serine exporter family protein [Kofleriaceae bacterium]MCB9574268.1 threonine/serine exporter family protein [Kofleriaceae bacterium]
MADVVAPTPEPADPGVAFVLALARALHRYGTPAHQLEDALAVIASHLGLRAQFFSTPTTILISFGDPSELRTAMLRVEGGELDMNKLAQLDALGDDVIARRIDVADATARIDDIVGARPRYGRAAAVLAHGLTTAAVVVFFHGGVADAGVAGAIGLGIGLLSLWMQRSTAQTRVFELVGAFLAAFVGGLAAAWIDGVSSSVVTIAGLLVLLPGMTLTVAMTELATRNLISGTARLTAAIIVLLELALGVAVGDRAARALVDVPAIAPVPLPAWSEWIAVVTSALAMVVLVRAAPRAAPWIVLATVTGFVGTRTGTALLGPELGVLVGAFALGVLVNVYARLMRRPAQVVLVPATLLLVPGSLGFRGMSSLLHRNTLTGVESTFAMFMVATAIVAGLLIANATLSPRRVL